MKSSPMTIQNKILRKAFYENSSNFEDSIQFVEVSNSRVGSVIGLKSPSDIVLIQPKNEFNEYGTKYRLFNQDLERSHSLDFLIDSNIQE
jgi:hypothetical protein